MLTITASPTSRDNARAYAVRDGAVVYADCLSLSEASQICRVVNLRQAVEAYERAERVASLLGSDPGQIADQAYLHLTRQAIACGYPWSADQTTHEWAKAFLEHGR